MVQPICLPSLEANQEMLNDEFDSLLTFGWAGRRIPYLRGLEFKKFTRERCQHYWTQRYLPGKMGNAFCASVVKCKWKVKQFLTVALN